MRIQLSPFASSSFALGLLLLPASSALAVEATVEMRFDTPIDTTFFSGDEMADIIEEGVDAELTRTGTDGSVSVDYGNDGRTFFIFYELPGVTCAQFEENYIANVGATAGGAVSVSLLDCDDSDVEFIELEEEVVNGFDPYFREAFGGDIVALSDEGEDGWFWHTGFGMAMWGEAETGWTWSDAFGWMHVQPIDDKHVSLYVLHLNKSFLAVKKNLPWAWAFEKDQPARAVYLLDQQWQTL